MTMRLIILACLAVLGSTPALAAGTVQVNFVNADRFTDIGRGVVERQRSLDRIAEHLRTFGLQLADGQTLTVDVTDVDLAGELRFMRHIHELRVLKGGVDWPRIALRWSLAGSDGKALKSGDEQLKDMAYLMRTPRRAHSDAMAYDLRLLDEWFAARFGAAAPN